MRILAIDTSTKDFCMGLYGDGKAYGFTLETGRSLSGLIHTLIKRALDSLGWKAGELDYLGLGLGPGSFTGLRIGAATVKGLSWPGGIPVAGVSTLDILAKGAGLQAGEIVPVIDARRGLVYSAAFRNDARRLKRVRPYALSSIKELVRVSKPGSLFLGDGVALYRDKLAAGVKGARLLDKDLWFPKPHSLIALVLEKIREKRLSDAFKVEPIYLYPKECQIKSIN